tara:strand:- start:36 stop:314 length:279 start_codon:yes stop_codon:yes gene_type:complete
MGKGNEKEKFYCPFCDLPLNGKRHESESMAFDLYACEYDASRSEKRPISELEKNEKNISEMKKERSRMYKLIKQLKARNEEIEKLRKEQENG